MTEEPSAAEPVTPWQKCQGSADSRSVAMLHPLVEPIPDGSEKHPTCSKNDQCVIFFLQLSIESSVKKLTNMSHDFKDIFGKKKQATKSFVKKRKDNIV